MKVRHTADPRLWLPEGMRSQQMPGELSAWPLCVQCDTPVHAYEIVHEGSTCIEIAARCHGKWECQRIEWWKSGSRASGKPDDAELRRQISNLRYFSP